MHVEPTAVGVRGFLIRFGYCRPRINSRRTSDRPSVHPRRISYADVAARSRGVGSRPTSSGSGRLMTTRSRVIHRASHLQLFVRGTERQRVPSSTSPYHPSRRSLPSCGQSALRSCPSRAVGTTQESDLSSDHGGNCPTTVAVYWAAVAGRCVRPVARSGARGCAARRVREEASGLVRGVRRVARDQGRDCAGLARAAQGCARALRGLGGPARRVRRPCASAQRGTHPTNLCQPHRQTCMRRIINNVYKSFFDYVCMIESV